jgi:hypothetical protein
MSEFEPEADEATSDGVAASVADGHGEARGDTQADVDITVADATAALEPAPAAGDSSVTAALTELDTLDERDLAAHPDVYQRIHSELQRALSSIDDA